MCKRVLTIIALLAVFTVGSATARQIECFNSYVQHWLIYSANLALPVGCLEGGDWDIDIDKNLGQKQKQQLCAKAINSCANGNDTACFIAFDTCGYSTTTPCKRWIAGCEDGNDDDCAIAIEYCDYENACYSNWKPKCDDDDQCLFAYNKCGKYLSDNCDSAGAYCAVFGWPDWCDYWYDPCMRNFPCEKWKKECKEKKSVAACEMAEKECGLKACRDVWKPWCNETNNCKISKKYCNGYTSTRCQINHTNCTEGDEGMPTKCDESLEKKCGY